MADNFSLLTSDAATVIANWYYAWLHTERWAALTDPERKNWASDNDFWNFITHTNVIDKYTKGFADRLIKACRNPKYRYHRRSYVPIREVCQQKIPTRFIEEKYRDYINRDAQRQRYRKNHSKLT